MVHARSAAPITPRFPVLPVISGALVIGLAVLVVAFVLSRVEDEQHRGGPLRNPAPLEGAGPINTAIEGLTTFRGNATRTYYGEGPVPEDPEVLWRYPPSGGMCSESSDEEGTRTWCGTGWTGQPNVVAAEGGPVEVRFGAYDRAVHVVHGRTGRDL